MNVGWLVAWLPGCLLATLCKHKANQRVKANLCGRQKVKLLIKSWN